MDGQNQNPTPAERPNHFDPDTEILMQAQPAGTSVAPTPQSYPVQPTTPPQSTAQYYTPQAPSATLTQQVPVQAQQASAQAPTGFSAGFEEFDSYDAQANQPSEDMSESRPTDELSWSAPEFEKHPKPASWYAGLAAIAILVSAIAYLINHDIITIVVVLMSAALFGYVASRDPRIMRYSVNSNGVFIGERFYAYAQFSAFTVVEQANSLTIDLVPLKRFSPMLSISYTSEIEPDLLNLVSQHLPYANHKRSLTEDLMHRIRF